MTQPNSERKRLPATKRVATSELPNLRVTTRDVEILLVIFLFRALTASQIARLAFGSKTGEVNSRCKHRLKLLYQYAYVARYEQPSRLSEGRKPLVYVLDRRGIRLLESKKSLDVSSQPRAEEWGSVFLDHLLATNDVHIDFSLSTKNHGWEIITYYDDKMLKSPHMKDKVTLRGDKGGKIQAAVVPDAYIRLDARENIYNLFLEIDRGTVTGEASEWGRRDWSRKIKAFLEYYRSGLYQKRYHTSDMRVLTITTSETRLANLKEITEAAGGRGRFWFSTFERLHERDILTDELWSVATKDGLAALIPTHGGTVFKYES